MIQDPERYRFAVDTLAGVATVAILCATCHEAEDAQPVKIFDYSYPSLGDVQAAVDEHEASWHAEAT